MQTVGATFNEIIHLAALTIDNMMAYQYQYKINDIIITKIFYNLKFKATEGCNVDINV